MRAYQPEQVSCTGAETATEPADHDGAKQPAPFVIDCRACVHQRTSVCDDCVVSFVVGREVDDALIISADEARAVHLLEGVGLLPGARHELRVG